MRRSIFCVTVSLFMVLAGLPALASGAFLAEFEDLPLAPGLSEVPGGMLFESPTGRILEASASGPVGAAEVKTFYSQTLPQLGWKKSGDQEFRRDNEILRIDVRAGGPTTTVRFSVVPQ